MDIYILRDGNQIGPFSEETTHQMLKQGVVLINDPAWRPGMAEWIPLHSVLYPAPARTETPSQQPEPAAAPTPGEPATGKQKAFLNYMGISFDSELSKDQAALLVNDAMENPKNAGRVSRWNDERLKLHPDLFAEELQARKEERPQRFFELCQTEGAEALEGVTKAHCQVLAGYLDVKHPNWDAGKESEAAWNYFFPAVAEKFPQLVRNEWKDKLQYPQGPKVSPELKRRASTAPQHTVAKPRKHSSPVASLLKGLVFGLLLVACGVGGLYVYKHQEIIEKAKAQWAVLQTKLSKKAPVAAQVPAATPAPSSSQDMPASESKTTGQNPPSPAASDPVATPAMESAKPTDTGMTDTAPAPALPEASTTPNNSNTSLFDPSPSMANDPVAGAGAGIPAPKTTVTLTQTLDLQLTYGKIKVPAGTQLPIVEQDGVNVKVRFQNQVISVPASATDLGDSGLPR